MTDKCIMCGEVIPEGRQVCSECEYKTEGKLTAKEMFELKEQGKTYKEIGEICELTRQRVYQIIRAYKAGKYHGTYAGTRCYSGRYFDVERIVYKGIYEHFVNSPYITVRAFTKRVFGKKYYPALEVRISNLITGKKDSFFTVEQLNRICKVIGLPFEEVFEMRE